MLNCLTYIAFVYWAVATVHTVLPIDVAVCGADAVKGGLGALFKHAFGGDLDVDTAAWAGFPCTSGLLWKLAFILRRPAATLRHILYGGGQDEPFVPILLLVPLLFLANLLLRRFGVRLLSDTGGRVLLKFGVAIGCRTVILLHSLVYPTKESVYFKRYSKVEFCIVAWTAYIIELPVWYEALVSGGTAFVILLLCALFPHHMLPEVNPINVATQGIAAAAFGIGHAYYLQRRRIAERAARAARAAAKAAAAVAAAAALEEQEEGQLLKAAAAQGASTSSTTVATSATASTRPTAAAALTVTATATGAVVASASRPAGSGGGGAAASLAALRRIHSMAGQSYVSLARPCRFAIKIQHAHLSDLPPDVLSVINSEALAGSGWQAVSAHAREGCVELVLDLRPLLPARPVYGNGGAAADDRQAQSDQDLGRANTDSGGGGGGELPAVRLDAAALRDLARSIVSYLHRSGVIQPDREQSVVLQLDTDTVVMTWQPESQAWVSTDRRQAATAAVTVAAAAAAAAAAVPPLEQTPPVLSYVSPRVVTWPGVGSRLRLTALLVGPSAEEVLAGGGIVVRTGTSLLSYSVLHVQPQQSAVPRPAAALAAASPPLLVEMSVIGAPVHGLLQVEARSSTGLLSAPLAVVVDSDARVVSGLAAVVGAMDDASADAFLRDYGSWLELAAARMRGAAAVRRDVSDVSADVATDTDGRGGKGSVGASAAVAAAANIFGPVEGFSTEGVTSRRGNLSYSDDLGGAGAAIDSTMLLVAADLLSVCCQGAGTNAAVAAAVDRLIDCVLSCDGGRSPAATMSALLNAVPAPPTGAGALHMAVAAGSRSTVAVLLHWHERLYGSAAASVAVGNPWLIRASCGVTPLHVAAAMPDGGAMAAWLLSTYDTAAASWAAAAAVSDDGLTPAALAAQLGGRWRLRLWCAYDAVRRSVRRAVALPPPLAVAAELVFGFRDVSLECQFTEAVNRQVAGTLALHAVVNAVLPLLSLAKAALYSSSGAALAALAFHLPHAAPLVAWLCRACSQSAPPSVAALNPSSSTAVVAAAVPPTRGSRRPPPRPRPLAAAARPQSPRGSREDHGAAWLRSALLAMHLCRAAAKAAAGLSLWPFALPRGWELFMARGGDVMLEAVVRPLLEQVGLPARLLLSLADGPATWLLYRGLEKEHPGLVPRPLRRAVLYQVVLLTTTAAVCATSRARFIRNLKAAARDKVSGTGAAAAAESSVWAAGLSPSSSSSSLPSIATNGSDGGRAGRLKLPSRVPSGNGGGSGKGTDNNAASCTSGGGGGGDKPRVRSLRGDDQMAGAGGGGAAATAAAGGAGCRARCGWTWLRGR